MSDFVSAPKRQRYSLIQKEELGKLCFKFKTQYEEEMLKLPKKWDAKRRQFTQPTPKEGYIARALRQTYPDLKTKSNS